MKRDLTLLEQRRLHIQAEIGNAEKATQKVRELSQQLFVSEATIWRDFTITIKTTNEKT